MACVAPTAVYAGRHMRWKAALLGVVEGVTEYLPISSTGHLILVAEWIDYPEPQRVTFEIFIQLGAILAVVWLYRRHLWELVCGIPSSAQARATLGKVLLAFLPAAFAGFLFHRMIEAHLFRPTVVATSLVVGGVVLLWLEARNHRGQQCRLEDVSWRQAALIGLAQVASLVPGVSRAAATIAGGLWAGLTRPVATQFSFYLAIPTLGAASLYSLFRVRAELSQGDVWPLAIGFTVAFLSAAVTVEALIRFVQRHTFRVFAYYRIALGLVVLWYWAS